MSNIKTLACGHAECVVGFECRREDNARPVWEQKGHPSKAQRIAVCEMTSCTLNGMSARVTGYSNDFATVTQLSTGLSAEWSWETAFRIATRHGRFES